MDRIVIDEIHEQLKTYNLDENDYFDKSIDWLGKHNVSYMNDFIDKEFPLKKKVPELLFLLGNKSLLNKLKIGIVGSRKGDNYAKSFIEQLVKKFENIDCVTISGFALGIDSHVHRMSLKYNVPTIAIIGNGFAIDYPMQNKKLKKEIIEKGLFISQFSPFIKPYSWNFIKRNLLIAYFSDILIIVEGGKASGTLSTLNWALKANKKIYALPGDIDKILSYAPNYAISKGAEIIYSLNDIDFIKDTKKDNRKKINLEENESIIFNLIKEHSSIDEILDIAPFEKDEILSIIIKLELKGIIRRDFNNTIYTTEDFDG